MVTQFSLLEGIKLRYILEIVLVPLKNYPNDFVLCFLYIIYHSFSVHKITKLYYKTKVE